MNELINLSNELVHKLRIYEDYRPGTVLIGPNDALMDGYYLLFDNYNIIETQCIVLIIIKY